MDKLVKGKIESIPQPARAKLYLLRELIFDVAQEEGHVPLVESLKWGQPSYASKNGSPIRFDWNHQDPEIISVYFNCNTTLVETFRELYGDTLTFNGNRELVLPISESLPTTELKSCLSMALNYHCLKMLPLLGA